MHMLVTSLRNKKDETILFMKKMEDDVLNKKIIMKGRYNTGSWGKGSEIMRKRDCFSFFRSFFAGSCCEL